MKTILIIIAAAGLCGCGDNRATVIASGEQKIQLRRDLLAQMDSVIVEIKEVESRMRKMEPGGDLEIESAELRDKRDELRVITQKLDSTY